MTDTTRTDTPRRRFLRRTAIGTLIATIVTGVGLTAFAYGHGPGGWHRGGFMGAHLDPAKLDAHLDRMLKHLYVEVDATDAQKLQLTPILKGAARDLLPMRDRMREGRQQAVALLSQPAIDRGALETLRANQLQLAEQASRRLTQALADVADVLTPEQRKQLAERAARWQGRRG
jgi:periplasmic protein CpxP/Spy